MLTKFDDTSTIRSFIDAVNTMNIEIVINKNYILQTYG